MIVDFKEIPPANSSDGNQDQFELFARDFVENLGFLIIEQPDRGQDGGKDILISEKLKGIRKSSERTWVLSAKHFAPSGKSVGINDEINIRDRVEKYKADGFFGFYSTLPSSGLSSTFKGLTNKLFLDYFDSGMIQNELITNPILENVFRAYFPISFLKFKSIGGYPATTKDLHTSFTGGDSFPLIDYGINSEGWITPTLLNRGAYTIYDLDVIISYSIDRGGPYLTRQSFPFLHPQSNIFCNSFKLDKVIAKGEIYSQIYARNGVFFQTTGLGAYKNNKSSDEFIRTTSKSIYKQGHQSKSKELVYSTNNIIKNFLLNGEPIEFIKELKKNQENDIY
ncbi:hypothetical protein [Winogradskyella sp. UBA3174]|uniref:hypothetical protein n=1 Tax=Winogradskyella sp. UBA3174 TaxID=1947785 RepID=UPI0025DEA30A|nr:hypothetical protein [Winogradskyella sp. UBA3174]|tara:strand:- start:2199 stop:3212 length:1014 start_codon:yes stop_codon:yes gene_type:complete